MGKTLIALALLLAASCQALPETPTDGVFQGAGSSLEILGGRCVRAAISEGLAYSYRETPRTWTASGDIHTSGTFPYYEYSHTDGEVSWHISATFNTCMDFTASVYIEYGDSKTIAPDVHFELQTQ